MKRKRGLVHVILALLMSMLLVVSTGCGKSGSGDSSSDKKTDKTETLADVNTIPEDGVITKEQFKTVAGENKKVQFKGTTDDGITYIWTYDCSKIQNPADQNLKIDFSEKGLDDLKKQANNANDALKMTMYGKGLICVPDLEVQLPEAWQSNSAYLVKEQSGKLARMSDVVVTAQVKEENAKKQDKNVIAVVGGADDAEIDKAYEMGVTAVFPINRLPQDFSVSRHHSKENLAYTVDNILRLIAAK